MNGKPIVLLAGVDVTASATLQKWLAERGWGCRVAACFEDICTMLVQNEFDVVLCRYNLPDRTAFPLMDWLDGSRSTLIFCADFGGQNRWLPVVERGKRCLNRPVFGTADLPHALADLFNTQPATTLAGQNA